MLVVSQVSDLTSIVSKSCKQQNYEILDNILTEIKLCSTTRSLVQSQETTCDGLDKIYSWLSHPSCIWTFGLYFQLYFDTLEKIETIVPSNLFLKNCFRNLFSTCHWGCRPKAGVQNRGFNLDMIRGPLGVQEFGNGPFFRSGIRERGHSFLSPYTILE